MQANPAVEEVVTVIIF